MPQVLTANRLSAGEVVYWSAAKGWVQRLADADVLADDAAEAPPHQLALQCLQQVLGVVFLDLEFFVSCHSEGVVLYDRHAREQHVEVTSDDVLEGDEALRAHLDKARQ